MMEAGELLRAEGVTVVRDGVRLLDEVSLSLASGRIVTLVGPNGAGKTTLVRVLLGVMRADSGSVLHRPGLVIGYVPQRFVPPPSLPMDVDGFLALGGERSASHRFAILDSLGAGYLHRRTLRALSGGEMQRALLARALLRKPDLLVLDEPAQGLDVHGQQEFYALIARQRDTTGCGVLMISHDLHLVMAATDEVICLEHHVCCKGKPEVVSQHPEYMRLFGTDLEGLAIYQHHHDHRHNLHGDVVAHPGVHGPGCAEECRHD